MQRFLESGLTNAVLASFLALLAFLIGRAARRLGITHTLWLLALLKLLTPPLVAVPLPLPGAIEATFAKSEPAAHGGVGRPAPSAGVGRPAPSAAPSAVGEESLIEDE